MERQTFLVVDANGHISIGARDTTPGIHSDEDLVELFVAENKIFGKCEVKQI